MQGYGKPVVAADGSIFPITPAIHVGGLIFLSGQLALRDGRVVGDTIGEQTILTLDNIAALLAPLGRSLAHVVKMTAWLTRAEDFAGFNAAYGARFTRPFPARSTVISGLLIPGALVELEAIVTAA